MNSKRLDNLNENVILKQFSDIKLIDFDKHPIWVNCHGIDYGKSWYEKTDEETFRPLLLGEQIDPKKAMFLVKSIFKLADGTTLNGFITPIQEIEDNTTKMLGMIQPYIFSTNNEIVRFWYGTLKPSDKQIERNYHLLGKETESVFPISFKTYCNITNCVFSGDIPGFCYIKKDKEIEVIN